MTVRPFDTRARAIVIVVALSVFAAFVVACSSNTSDGEAPTSTATSTSAEATPTADEAATPADTPPADDHGSLPEGLQEILDDVADVRGLPAPTNLWFEIITRAELPPVYNGLLTDDDLEYADDITDLYRLIGFIENDQDYLEIYQSFISDAVLGFYVPELNKLWVVSDDGGLVLDDLSRNERSTLAHELVHAIQDFNFQLDVVDDSVGDSPDRALAFSALVEGDAVTFEEVYSDVYLARLGPATLLLSSPLGQLGIPDPILREEFFPYSDGPDFVAGIVDQFGVERVNELLQNPPVSTSQILHPELLANGWQPEEVELPDLSPVLGDQWAFVMGGAFGEFEIANYLAQQLSGRDALSAAEGWAGDQYALYASDTETAVAFRLRFVDDVEAREFADVHDAYLASAATSLTRSGNAAVGTLEDGDGFAAADISGREAVYVYATSPELAESLLEAILNG